MNIDEFRLESYQEICDKILDLLSESRRMLAKAQETKEAKRNITKEDARIVGNVIQDIKQKISDAETALNDLLTPFGTNPYNISAF